MADPLARFSGQRLVSSIFFMGQRFEYMLCLPSHRLLFTGSHDGTQRIRELILIYTLSCTVLPIDASCTPRRHSSRFREAHTGHDVK